MRRDLACRSPACDSRDVRVDGVPFVQDAAELRRRRASMLLMNLALEVLGRAARSRGREPIDTSAVRLALRVLHPLLGDQDMLTTFWREVTSEAATPWNGALQSHRWIVARLVARGHAVWSELR